MSNQMELRFRYDGPSGRESEPISLGLSRETRVENLTPLQWQYASSFCYTMKPSKEVTVMMSADKFPTSSSVVLILNVLLHLLPKMQEGISELQHFLVQNICERWPNHESITTYAKATVTDSRFKLTVLSEVNRTAAINAVTGNDSAHQ
jgi:hypothetical protein